MLVLATRRHQKPAAPLSNNLVYDRGVKWHVVLKISSLEILSPRRLNVPSDTILFRHAFPQVVSWFRCHDAWPAHPRAAPSPFFQPVVMDVALSLEPWTLPSARREPSARRDGVRPRLDNGSRIQLIVAKSQAV
jgi:hypothetical protein